MVMLFWTKLNQTVKIVNTKKKFFNNYLYKIVVWCPGGRLITDKHSKDAAFLLKRRVEYLLEEKSYNYGGSWFNQMTRSKGKYLEDNADVNQLQYYIDLNQQHADVIKLRIEEPTITVYSNDEALLYNIASRFSDRLKEWHRPENSSAADILNRGEIVAKTEPQFPYKIVLKEHVFADKSVKNVILDHLYNLDKNDEVCLTKSIVKHLGSQMQYFPGGYFYAKDTTTITFINLICPGIITGIFKLTKLD